MSWERPATEGMASETERALDDEFRKLPVSVQRELARKSYTGATSDELAEKIRQDRADALRRELCQK